jgi:hypothetical protein
VNINDLEARSERSRLLLTGPVTDAEGQPSHRLLIEGPEDLVRTTLGEADVDVEIRPGGNRDTWERALAERVLTERAERERPERENFAFKSSPDAPTMENTVTVAVHKTFSTGTSYIIRLPFVIAQGVNLFVVLPFVCSAAAMTLPTSGDPDLFLELAPFGPVVAASTNSGSAVDSVSFSLPLCLPFTGFVPFCRIYGFTAASGTFVGGGYLFP